MNLAMGILSEDAHKEGLTVVSSRQVTKRENAILRTTFEPHGQPG
jgi:hypothetical protein